MGEVVVKRPSTCVVRRGSSARFIHRTAKCVQNALFFYFLLHFMRRQQKKKCEKLRASHHEGRKGVLKVVNHYERTKEKKINEKSLKKNKKKRGCPIHRGLTSTTIKNIKRQRVDRGGGRGKSAGVFLRYCLQQTASTPLTNTKSELGIVSSYDTLLCMRYLVKRGRS